MKLFESFAHYHHCWESAATVSSLSLSEKMVANLIFCSGVFSLGKYALDYFAVELMQSCAKKSLWGQL